MRERENSSNLASRDMKNGEREKIKGKEMGREKERDWVRNKTTILCAKF